MEEMYWKKFEASGQVDDYLHYRGIAICKEVMKRYQAECAEQTGDRAVESDRSYGNGACHHTYW